MRKIAVSLAKGGTGKTTTAVNLSAGLARDGYMVLLVDTDTQGQVGAMLGIHPEFGLAELIEDELDPQQIVVEAREQLWVLAGTRSLAGLKRSIARKDFGGEKMLAESLAPLDDQFDFVILDTAPGWDPLTVNVMFYIQEIIAPVSLEVLSLHGLLEFSQRIESIKAYHPGLSLKYIVPTFLDRRVKKSAEILAQLRSRYHQQICEPIRYNVRLSEAPGFDQTIFEYSPRSSGAQDYQRLVERIEDGSQENA